MVMVRKTHTHTHPWRCIRLPGMASCKSDGNKKKKKTLFKEPQLIITFIHLHLCGQLIMQFYPTGKPGDSLPVKRKPEKLIHLKKKVCNDVVW